MTETIYTQESQTTTKIDKLDFDSFAPKLGSWAPYFQKFIEGKEMWDIMQRIREDAWYPDGRRKETIVPAPENT